MSCRQLAIFARGARWVLLDEGSAELGEFASQADALARAAEYVCGRGEPRYVMIKGDEGWREALVEPANQHAA